MKAGIGVPHVAEMDAIWSHKNQAVGSPKTFDFNANIPRLMQKYWVSFVMTLDPNKLREPGSPFWDEWTANAQGGGQMRRLVVQQGVNASTMEAVPIAQQTRCGVLQSWFIRLTQ